MRIGVDLGGTNVRVGLVKDGHVMRLLCEPCKADRPEWEVVDHIASLIASLMTPGVSRIGVGVPSVVDADKGIVYNVAGIPSWQEVHLKEQLEKRFRVPVYINNDCNCFALGVCRFGEASAYRDVVCVALGTGVGAGIVIGGNLYCGRDTGAGEIGSIPYLDRDYEYYCSSRFFVGRGTTGKEAYDRAVDGDPEALSLWDEFGGHIGDLVMMILYAYDPEAIVFGGSIAHAFDFFRDAMYERLKEFPYAKTLEGLHICCSSVEHVGLLGASACE
ncbi:ROK family protein [uncultured Alistipes sp.]|uniref:ROK family protein n=1 Tax=uncultured Alistipes sp. TaxID=538949 RepID=UPI0025F134D3|nr:ROK family protein [uncultured Alistipes sp.]